MEAKKRGDLTSKVGCTKNEQFKNSFALYKSILEGKTESVKRLLAKGVDPNLFFLKYRPLCLAALEGHKEIVKLLLEAKVDPNELDKWNISPLMSAMQELCAMRLFDNVQKDYIEIVELLLAKGAKPNENNFNEHGETLLYLAIREAIQKDCIQMVASLLEKGANPNTPNKDKDTPLGLVVIYAPIHPEICFMLAKLLLEKGADPNQKNRFGVTPFADSFEYEGHYPFDYPKHTKITELFIQHKADFNVILREGTLLYYAAKKGDVAKVRELLKKDANPNVYECPTKAPLYIAALTAHIEIAKLLYIADNKEDAAKLSQLLSVLEESEKQIIRKVIASIQIEEVQVKKCQEPLKEAQVENFQGPLGRTFYNDANSDTERSQSPSTLSL